MRNIKLTIAYDGTSYCGWQVQKNSVSVQHLIEKALKKILHEKIKLAGSSRTDSGVHAKGQIANFRTCSVLSFTKIKSALNSNLPRDISITGIFEVRSSFHAQHDAKSKVYRYTIVNSDSIDPFIDRYSVFIKEPLEITLMEKAAGYLRGRHDFSSFKAAKGTTKTSVREIKRIAVTKKGSIVYISIEASGFLYNMARNIVGTLIDVGRGKLEPEEVKKILAARDRRKAGPTAPAKGLTLIKIKY